MLEDELEAELDKFLREHIHSFEEVDTLLLLHGDRSRRWSANAVGHALRIPAEAALAALERLREQGFLDFQPGTSTFVCRPASVALDAGIGLLADAYGKNRLLVIQSLSRHALDRVRRSMVQAFAEGFRIRGPKKRG